jgi:hypothetical protein
MDFGEMVYEDVNWIHLDDDPVEWWVLVNTMMNFWIP